jgi:hypothetical protein
LLKTQYSICRQKALIFTNYHICFCIFKLESLISTSILWINKIDKFELYINWYIWGKIFKTLTKAFILRYYYLVLSTTQHTHTCYYLNQRLIDNVWISCEFVNKFQKIYRSKGFKLPTSHVLCSNILETQFFSLWGTGKLFLMHWEGRQLKFWLRFILN